jgi:hypothetical protein
MRAHEPRLNGACRFVRERKSLKNILSRDASPDQMRNLRASRWRAEILRLTLGLARARGINVDARLLSVIRTVDVAT